MKSKILEINIRISEIDKEIEQKLSIKRSTQISGRQSGGFGCTNQTT